MKKDSEYIKEFLDFLRQSDTEANIAESILRDADDKTQDILHHIELNECTLYDFICLGIALKQSRQTRRKAKDKLATLLPVCMWVENNEKIIRELEKLLGEIRKEEKRMTSRGYRARTDTVRKALENGGE